MRSFILCFVFCLATAHANAQAITGVVSDDTGAVLLGVLVELRIARTVLVSTSSDATGRYGLTPPGAGTFDVVFSLINFADVTKRVKVDEGEHLAVNVVLPLILTAEVAVTGSANP